MHRDGDRACDACLSEFHVAITILQAHTWSCMPADQITRIVEAHDVQSMAARCSDEQMLCISGALSPEACVMFIYHVEADAFARLCAARPDNALLLKVEAEVNHVLNDTLPKRWRAQAAILNARARYGLAWQDPALVRAQLQTEQPRPAERADPDARIALRCTYAAPTPLTTYECTATQIVTVLQLILPPLRARATLIAHRMIALIKPAPLLAATAISAALVQPCIELVDVDEPSLLDTADILVFDNGALQLMLSVLSGIVSHARYLRAMHERGLLQRLIALSFRTGPPSEPVQRLAVWMLQYLCTKEAYRPHYESSMRYARRAFECAGEAMPEPISNEERDYTTEEIAAKLDQCMSFINIQKLQMSRTYLERATYNAHG